MNITVGSLVRSFDFSHHRDLEGERACFMEGEVVGFEKVQGCNRFVIEVHRCVFGGKERSDFPARIFPPVNGTPTWTGRVTDGVELLGTTPAFDIIMAS